MCKLITYAISLYTKVKNAMFLKYVVFMCFIIKFIKMKLEDRLDMGWFNFKQKGISEHTQDYISAKNGKEPESMSRRSFVQKLFGLGLGAAISGTGTVYSNDANAESNEVPPGIEEAAKRDPAIKTAYQYWHYPQWLNSYNSSSKDIVQYILNGYNPTGKVVHTKILSETPYLEPAYWFLSAEMSNGTISGKEIRNKNLPLSYFAAGIGNYFTAWVEGHRNREYHPEVFKERTEDYLLKSLFTSAGESEDKVGIYKGYSLELKKRYLQTKIMKNLETTSYNNQLVAAWSSFFLTNHYRYMEFNVNNKYEKDGDNINLFIEKPLRKYIPQIRGPPYYLDFTGKYKV